MFKKQKKNVRTMSDDEINYYSPIGMLHYAMKHIYTARKLEDALNRLKYIFAKLKLFINQNLQNNSNFWGSLSFLISLFLFQINLLSKIFGLWEYFEKA